MDVAPEATVRVEAFNRLYFEPKRIGVQAGVPTRIEFENTGATDHLLVVKTPDGERDWVHLHAPPRVIIVAICQLEELGTYQLLCAVTGRTEGRMIGELVVLPGPGAVRSHH